MCVRPHCLMRMYVCLFVCRQCVDCRVCVAVNVVGRCLRTVQLNRVCAYYLIFVSESVIFLACRLYVSRAALFRCMYLCARCCMTYGVCAAATCCNGISPRANRVRAPWWGVTAALCLPCVSTHTAAARVRCLSLWTVWYVSSLFVMLCLLFPILVVGCRVIWACVLLSFSVMVNWRVMFRADCDVGLAQRARGVVSVIHGRIYLSPGYYNLSQSFVISLFVCLCVCVLLCVDILLFVYV